MQSPGSQLAALTRKLLPESAAIDSRLALADGSCLDVYDDHSLLASCRGWPAVRDVILRAVSARQPTLVYGDYDVDGTVAAFLLHRYLRANNVPGNFFIPSRLQHGYGLDRGVIEQAVAQGYRTLIAVDCGVANQEEVALARVGGMEVAIIDHHTCPDELPDAPVLNPHLEDELPPYCAGGLVLGVLSALRQGTGQMPEPDECELVALATLADIVPLEPHNWALAHHGIKAMAETCNAGLQQLIRVSGLHGLSRITGRQIVFSLVPRLNAAGRIRNARIVLDLLGAQSDDHALRLATMLDRLNSERKQVGDKVARAALVQAALYEDHAGVALYDADWHIGVLGIAAARVAKLLGKPAVVMADSPLAESSLTGSARSDGRADIIALLTECAGTIETFGGHGAAAGVQISRHRLEDFRTAWSEAARQRPAAEAVDYGQFVRVGLHELTEQFEADIWRLSPFGAAYPPPCCVLSDCAVERVSYMGQDKTHLNLVVTDGSRQVRIAGFNQSHLYNQLRAGTRIEPAVEIEADNYNNRYSIVLRLIGLANQDAEQGR